MNYIKSIFLIFTFVLSLAFFPQKINAASKTASLNTQIQISEVPLTKERVRHFIKTSIAVTKLQLKMKSESGGGHEIIQEFHKKRKTLIESQGWSVEDFENTRDRIYNVQNAIDQEDSLKNEEEFQQEIAEIEGNSYFSEEQKSQVIKLLRDDRNRVLNEVIAPTKPDWPAVEAYKKELNHLVEYIAENRSDPPVLN